MATKADSTLVQAAFREGQSGALADVPNLKPLYDQTTKIGDQYTKAIKDIVNVFNLKSEQEDLEKEKRLKPFKSVADEAFQTLYSQDEPMPQKVIDAVTAEVERLQAEFEKVNTEGKGDTRENERARMKITGDLKRITNEAINTRANFMKMTGSAGDWNPKLIDTNKIDPIKSILDLKNMDKNNGIKVAYVDGKLTFTTENYSTGVGIGVVGPEGITREEYKLGDAVSFNSDQMAAALPKVDLNNDKWLLEGQNSAAKQGQMDAKNKIDSYYDSDYAVGEVKSEIESQIKTEDQFQDIMSRKMDGINAPSFMTALRSRMDIPLSTFDNMFYDDNGKKVDLGGVFAELDKNNDGDINTADSAGLKGEALQSFENNYNQMIDALVNINNPAFDLKTSKGLLVDYYADLRKQAYEANYKRYTPKSDIITPDSDSDGKTYLPENMQGLHLGFGIGGKKNWVTRGNAIGIMKAIETGAPFGIGAGENKHVYSFHEGSWWQDFDTDTEEEIGTVQQLVGSKLNTNDRRFMDLVTEVPEEEGGVDLNIQVGEGGVPISNPFKGEIPEDFITAVGKDDNNVIEYIRDLAGDKVQISKGYNLDTIIIKAPNGESKQFTVDPNVAKDKDRASEIWNWINKNFSEKKKYDK